MAKLACQLFPTRGEPNLLLHLRRKSSALVPAPRSADSGRRGQNTVRSAVRLLWRQYAANPQHNDRYVVGVGTRLTVWLVRRPACAYTEAVNGHSPRRGLRIFLTVGAVLTVLGVTAVVGIMLGRTQQISATSAPTSSESLSITKMQPSATPATTAPVQPSPPPSPAAVETSVPEPPPPAFVAPDVPVVFRQL